MIPQAELDRAIARWKARKAGATSPVPEAIVAVEGEFEAPPAEAAFDLDASEATVISSDHGGEVEVGSGLISIAEYDEESR